jgi:hypothetical protein
MRISHLLTSAVLFFIFSSPAFAQQETSDNRPTAFTLNPVLRDVNQVLIVISLRPADCDPNGLLADQIEQQVEAMLRKAGIEACADINTPMAKSAVKDLTERTGSIPKGLKFHQSNIPEFRIEGEVFQIPDTEQRVFHIRVSLAKDASLKRNPSDIPLLKADVWEKEPAMQLAASKSLADSLTAVVLEEVHAFIVDWSIEKSSGKHSDVNQPRSQLRKVKVEKDSKLAKQQDTEAKFVASKNSDKFHKASCPSAKRISANNLVAYNTRDDAIAAGKKPCQRCDP